MYFKCPAGNFGDDLNEWIWDRLIPGWQQWDDDVTLFGVGTLINDRSVAAYAHERTLILGTGVGYGDVVKGSIPRSWDFRSVRGPRSARLLGLSEARGLIDPAVMISDFPEFQKNPKSDTPIFVPHHASVDRHDWSRLCRRFGLNYVSPNSDAVSVIQSIAKAPLVVAESMHAAIIAESFRVPWVPASIGPKFNAEKWIDFFESCGLEVEILGLFPSVDRLAKQYAQPRLRRYQRRARVIFERFHAEKSFDIALNTSPFLGDTGELERRKIAYRQVLEDARRRYA